MSLDVKSTADLAKGHMSMLVYSIPKEGKTTFASTLPNPLFINLEQGLKSIRMKSIDYVEPNSWTEILSVIMELQREAKPGVVTYKGKEYNSVVVDPLNELYAIVMRSILMGSGRELPHLQDWGLAGSRVERTIVEFVKLPVHTCFTCLEQIDKDEMTGRIFAAPLLPGKLSKKVPALFDFVFHAETVTRQDGKGVDYKLLTKSSGVYMAGGRYGNAVVELREVPDFNTILTKINQGGK